MPGMSERAVIPWSGPRFEVRRLAGLAWPVSLAYIGNVTLGTVDVMMAGGWRMSGQRLPDEARPIVQKMAQQEARVVVRCRPYSTFATPPRHLQRNDQEQKITHWLSGAVPWDARDDADVDR